MSLGRPRALLFDWDNTLVDSWRSIHDALNHTLESMGHAPWTLEETRARVRASARDSFPVLFGGRAGEAMEIFYQTFEAHHLRRLQECPGAGAMLRTLAADGLYLAVVSNKLGRLLRREAEHLGWSGLFSRLVGATDAERDKPAAESVALALRDSGIAPGEQVWFIGDTDIDLLCAVNAGCMPILMRPEPPGPDEFPGTPPRRHVATFAELIELLKTL